MIIRIQETTSLYHFYFEITLKNSNPEIITSFPTSFLLNIYFQDHCRCCNRHFVDRISSKRFQLRNIRHYLRVHVRTAFIIDTVQDGEQQYEKLSSHVQDVLHMLIALSRRVLHKESRLASLRTGREQVLCLLSPSGITINK